MNGWVVLLWSFVAALVLIIGGIFIALVMMGRIALFPETEPTVAPTPVETGIVDTTYAVMILNGTAEEGLAGDMRDVLLNSGWPAENVSAGDSSSQDFEATTVYYVAEADELAAIGLANLIGGAAVQQSDFYAAEAAPDQKQLTIVIGLDRATAAPEEPAESPAE